MKSGTSASQYLARFAGAVLLTLMAASASATPITLTPGDAVAQSNDANNATTLELVNSIFGTDFEDLELIFKEDNPEDGASDGDQSGSLTGSYDLQNYLFDAISGETGDLTGADLVNTGSPVASCPTCVAIVKDGNNGPAQYLFDLSSWDGVMTLEFRDFWPDDGSISNIAIWAGETQDVPAPGIVGLLGIGLLGLGAFARRRRSA